MERKLLILDIDETLIHAREEPLARTADFHVTSHHIYRRPHLGEFLNFAQQHFRVAFWSSSTNLYVRAVLPQILPDEFSFVFAWGRDRCTMLFDYELQSFYWLKNLRKVKKQGFVLGKVIMVDDSPEKLKKNYGNLVRVAPFNGDESDDELKWLMVYLKWLDTVPNVRTVEKRGWRFQMERRDESPID